MAITVGTTKSNSTNQTGSTGFSFNHTTDADTKCLVVVVTGVDSSPTDSVVSTVTWNSIALEEIVAGRYRVGNDFISIWYKVLPTIEATKSIAVTMGGSCTDVQATAINLIDASAYSIVYDSFDTGTGTGSASSVVSPARTGSIAVGGGVANGGTLGSLTISPGTLVTGSGVDMGSQVASVGYVAEGSGSATITWTYAAVVCSSLAATFYSEFAPTVALSSPTNTHTGDSLTPALVFTGTDANATDELEYQIQIDTNNSFNSINAGTTIDSNVTAASYYVLRLDANTRLSQSFTGSADYVDQVIFRLKKLGTPTGTLTAYLYAHSGVFGTSSVPTGIALTTSSNTINVADLTTNAKEFTFNFDHYLLTNTTKYCIVLVLSGGTSDTNNSVLVGVNTSSVHAGNLAAYTSSWAESAVYDLYFKVIEIDVCLIDKLSDTALVAGFSGTGDPHPWLQGVAVTFTVQAADTLTNSRTYYWRVRAKDPLGTNVWGEWSSPTWSFTTLDAGPPPVGQPYILRLQGIPTGSKRDRPGGWN